MEIKHNKKSVRGFFLITAIAIINAIAIVLFVLPLGGPSPIISYKSEIVWTKDELTEAFWEYEDELNEVAEIVLASESFRQRRDNNQFLEIRSDNVKNDFSEEDWEKIVDLFKKIRPYMITRSVGVGEDVVYIDFKRRKVDGGYMHIALHYFKNPETAEGYKNGTVYGGKEIEHLDGYWYIIERFKEYFNP